MKLALFLACLPLGAATVINSVFVCTTCQVQLFVDFTKTDSSPAEIDVSQSPSFSPLALPVDPTVFTNANLDIIGDERFIWVDPANPLHERFQAGIYGVVEPGIDGKNHSRALYANTPYYVRVKSGAGFSDVAVWSGNPVSTKETLVGASYRPDFIPASDKTPLYPEFPDFCTRSAVLAEPFTGRQIKRYGTQCDALRLFSNLAFQRLVNITSGWTITGTTLASFTSSSCSVACASLLMSYTNPTGITEAEESNPVSINYALLHFTGQCSGANTMTADCTTQVCWSWDGTTCSGPLVDLVVPTSSGNVPLCSQNGSATCIVGDLLGADYRGTFHQGLGTGLISTVGSSTTLTFTDSGDCAQRRVGEVITASNATAVQSLTIASLSCPTVTLMAAVNFDPGASGAFGYPFHYNDAFQGNPRWGFLIRKKSLTANNTISIANPLFDPTYGGNAASTSAGYNEFQTQFTDVNGFRKARNVTKIYAVKQDATGEVRFLGQTFGTGSNGLASGELCQQIGLGSTFWIDANSYYCIGPETSDMKPALFLVAFTGNTANDVEKLPNPASEETSMVAGVTYTNVSGDLLAKTHAAFPAFDNTLYTSVSIDGYSGGRYIEFYAELPGSQDTYCWTAVYDVMTNTVIAAWAPHVAPSATRWSVKHAGYWVAANNNAAATANLLGIDLKQGRDDVPNGGRYHFHLTQNLTTATTTFTIDSSTPVSPQPPMTLQAMIAGDAFICNGDAGEAFQVVSVNSTTNITATRGFGMTTAVSHTSGEDCAMKPYYNQANINNDNSGTFWAFLPDANGPTNAHVYMSYCPGGGHAYYYSIWMAGAPPQAGNVILMGIENMLAAFPLCFPPSFSQDPALPVFSGVGYGVNNSGEIEAHPSFKPLAYPVIVDNHPNIGAGTQEDTSFTRIGSSGTLFKLDYNENPFGGAPQADGYSTKFLPHLTTSQAKLFADISGPGSVIDGTATHALQRCHAFVANECISGSSPGDTYFNSPYMDPGNWTAAFGVNCWLSASIIDDTCSADLGYRAITVMGYVLPTTGAITTNPNKSFPLLYQFGQVPKNSPNTINTKLYWNGWAFGNYFNRGSFDSYFVQIPASDPSLGQPDNTQYVVNSVVISSVPSMTDHVLIEQGYADYSSTPYTLPYCTQRRDKCVTGAGNSGSNPFFYTVEGSGGVEAGLPGTPCSTGCMVNVLTLPGETMYGTLKYYTADNALISSVKLPMGGGGSPTPPPSTSSTILSGSATISGSARQ